MKPSNPILAFVWSGEISDALWRELSDEHPDQHEPQTSADHDRQVQSQAAYVRMHT
ncbi:MAG: hypothetical protein ACPGZP_09430 [Panacagrimonas sp.]